MGVVYNDMVLLCRAIDVELSEAVPNREFRNSLLERVSRLANYLENSSELGSDLSINESHQNIYNNIERISDRFPNFPLKTRVEKILKRAETITLAKKPVELANWINKTMGQNVVDEADFKKDPVKIVKVFEDIRKKFDSSNTLDYDFDNTLSQIFVLATNMQTLDDVRSYFKDAPKDIKAQALAHIMNAKKDQQLSLLLPEELNEVAPHLHEVILTSETSFENEAQALNFIKNCRNAYELVIRQTPLVTELTELPPKLEKFFSASSGLKKVNIENAPHLRDFTFYEEHELTSIEIDKAPQLQTFFSGHAPITTLKIRNAPQLKEIDSGNCGKLKIFEIGNPQELEVINLNHCFSLEKLDIPNLPKLRSLNFLNCSLLKNIQIIHAPQLRIIKGSGSPLLEAFAIPDTPNLEGIDLQNCRNLRTIHITNAPLLTTVKCNTCPNLRSFLGTQTLPNCNIFEYRNCPELIERPECPLARIASEGSHPLIIFAVDPNELETNPRKVLCDLGASLQQNQGMMPEIKWLNPHTGRADAGIDMGGLRSQLITTLSANLFNQDLSEEMRLPLIEQLETTRGRLPLLRDPTTEKELILGYKTLGKLIALCARTPLLLGKHFGENFYHAIFSLTDEEIQSIQDDQPLTDALKEKIYLNAQFSSPEYDEADPEGMKQNPIMIPIAIVAKELRAALGDKFHNFGTSAELKRFVESVEGQEVTLERLWPENKEDRDKIILFKGSATAAEIQQIERFFAKFIKSHKEWPQKIGALMKDAPEGAPENFLTKIRQGALMGRPNLADFLELLTSKRTLGKELIQVNVPKGELFRRNAQGDIGRGVEIHTCFNKIDVPPFKVDKEEEEYKRFEEMLLLSFANLKTFSIS